MISFDLKNKVAIVTGASQGLGIELSTTLAEHGADVVIMARNQEKLEKAAEVLRQKTGRKILAVPVDISDEQSVEKAVKTVMDEFGKIDILVNNAGIILYGSAEELPLEDWQKVINTDLTGTFIMSKAVVNACMKENGGKIINISSVNGKRATAAAPVYHVAKAATIALTESSACCWAKYGIFVNSIAPGFMTNGEMAPDCPIEIQESIKKNIPQNKLGEYGDLSGALLYLASDACTYTQGNTIVCDGGMILESF